MNAPNTPTEDEWVIRAAKADALEWAALRCRLMLRASRQREELGALLRAEIDRLRGRR